MARSHFKGIEQKGDEVMIMPIYNTESFDNPERPLNRVVIGHYACQWSIVVGDTIQFQAFDNPPNLWWRFWQWLLLGWKWESNEEADAARERRWQRIYGKEKEPK